MGDRQGRYGLTGTIELDDAFIGGHRRGVRGRGALGKTAIVVACEVEGNKPRFAAIETVSNVDAEQVKEFARRHLHPGGEVHTDGFGAMVGLGEAHHHVPKTTSPELAQQWLPWGHVLIANLKRFILETIMGSASDTSKNTSTSLCIDSTVDFRSPSCPTVCYAWPSSTRLYDCERSNLRIVHSQLDFIGVWVGTPGRCYPPPARACARYHDYFH